MEITLLAVLWALLCAFVAYLVANLMKFGDRASQIIALIVFLIVLLSRIS